MSLLARGVQSLSRNISRSAGNVKAPSLAAFYHKNVSDSYRKSALRGVVFPCVCVGGLATHVACRCVWTICSIHVQVFAKTCFNYNSLFTFSSCSRVRVLSEVKWLNVLFCAEHTTTVLMHVWTLIIRST